MGTFNWMVIPSFLLLLVISQSVISLEDTGKRRREKYRSFVTFSIYFYRSETILILNLLYFSDDGIEDDFEDIEDRQSLADYYGWDDGRAG